MVFVPWDTLGICKWHALHKTVCHQGETCRWRHPSEDELKRIWDDYSVADTQRKLPAADARNLPPSFTTPPISYQRAPPPPDHPVIAPSPRDSSYYPQATPPIYLPPRAELPPRPAPTPWQGTQTPSDFQFRGAYERRESALDSHIPYTPWELPGPAPQPTIDDRYGPAVQNLYGNMGPSQNHDAYMRDRSPPPRMYAPPHHYSASYAPPPEDYLYHRDIEDRVPSRRRSDSIFNPSRSHNCWVNGSKVYRFEWGNPLCVECGVLGHLPGQNKCGGFRLSKPEQDFLYGLVRQEQNRIKAERGLDRRQPTASLNPTPTPEAEAPLPPRPDMKSILEALSWPNTSGWRQNGPLEDQSGYWERAQSRRLPRSLLHDQEDDAVSTLQQTPRKKQNQKKKRKSSDAGDEAKETKKTKREVGIKDSWADETLGKLGPESEQPEPETTAPDVKAVEASLPQTSPPAPQAASVPSISSSPLAMGATKRLSNGEAKTVGPHPSTIRVSASYMTQSAIEKRLQPPALDAQERSLAEAREDSVRLQGVTWLDNVRRALQLPVKTYTTACVYYHKFRLAHPTVEYSYTDAAAASLLTSCKNEDTLKKSRDILAAAYNLKQPTTHEQVGADDPIFEAPSRVVIGLERLVLESGGFDFRSRSPHHTLIKISKSLPKSDDLRNVSQLAWTILTDIHRTFAVLKQTSSTLALASLELAAHFVATTSSNNTCTVRDDLQVLDLNKWHTTREEVMETLLDALDLYTHHTSSTILGNKYSLDDLLRIRLALNKECTESSLPRYTVIQPPPSPDYANGTSSTLRVANGHPTPVSPPQPGTQAPQQSNGTGPNVPTPEGGGTLRFMLNPQRATEERAEVNRYYTEEWEEYEEEIEVPIPRNRSRERDHDRRRDYSLDRPGPSGPPGPPGRSRREERDGPPGPRGAPPMGGERERLEEREREAEHERTRLRDRDRERRYDERRYDDRNDRRYDDRRGEDRDRRYYEDDRRRGRDYRR